MESVNAFLALFLIMEFLSLTVSNIFFFKIFNDSSAPPVVQQFFAPAPAPAPVVVEAPKIIERKLKVPSNVC